MSGLRIGPRLITTSVHAVLPEGKGRGKGKGLGRYPYLLTYDPKCVLFIVVNRTLEKTSRCHIVVILISCHR